MPIKAHPYIAREGWSWLLATVIAGVALHAVFGIAGSLAAGALAGILLFLFRDPTSLPPAFPLGMVGPVHGKVTWVGAIHDPWLDRAASVIVTRMALFDVHSIYSPIEGKLNKQWTQRLAEVAGEGVKRKAVAFWFRTDEGDDITVAVSRGHWGGRISFRCHAGERIGHGRRIGFAPLGSVVSVYAAENTRVEISPDDRVIGGSTVIASLVHDWDVSAIPDNRSTDPL